MQGMLLDSGPSHQAVERRFRQLSLRAHPDKNPDRPDEAAAAFARLQAERDAVIRGHELVPQVVPAFSFSLAVPQVTPQGTGVRAYTGAPTGGARFE